jgi:enolase
LYEERNRVVDAASVVRQMVEDGCLGRRFDQEAFDAYLEARRAVYGRQNACSLSMAFFNASTASRRSDLFAMPRAKRTPPRLCCNVLNGGRYAYTNPVLSDFPEYLLVAASHDIEEVIEGHNQIQHAIKERLLGMEKTVVAGNIVNRFSTVDNRECIDFLLSIVDTLGLAEDFQLMIDASAGDLRADGGYMFSLTDRAIRSEERLCEYWQDLIRQYNLAYLEDPFHEGDADSWCALTSAQSCCRIIGDNFYSSDADRIARGAAHRCTHGVVIKSNQSGTVSAVSKAVETALRHGQIVIASHRSVSTEETFLSHLACAYEVPLIKIGPLVSDYSSVIRLNEIIRLAGSRHETADDYQHLTPRRDGL